MTQLWSQNPIGYLATIFYILPPCSHSILPPCSHTLYCHHVHTLYIVTMFEHSILLPCSNTLYIATMILSPCTLHSILEIYCMQHAYYMQFVTEYMQIVTCLLLWLTTCMLHVTCRDLGIFFHMLHVGFSHANMC